MSKKITAQFHSVDAAEIASRFMRSHLEGIERICVISRRRVYDENSDYAITGGYMNHMNGFAYGATSDNRHAPDDRVDQDSQFEPALRREAYLAVTTDDENARSAEKLMRSLGGLSIKVDESSSSR